MAICWWVICPQTEEEATDSFWPNTCTTSHWYSNEKNKWQSKHSKYLLQTTRQRRALGQKALPALNPIPKSLTVTQTKISQRQLAISTGATLVMPAVSHPKQLTVFFRAQANIMPQPPCIFENPALSLHLETLFPWHTCWCASGAREACGFFAPSRHSCRAGLELGSLSQSLSQIYTWNTMN